MLGIPQIRGRGVEVRAIFEISRGGLRNFQDPGGWGSVVGWQIFRVHMLNNGISRGFRPPMTLWPCDELLLQL